MLSRTALLRFIRKPLCFTVETPECNGYLALVRWKKRRWAPLNPSKVFYVPERKAIDQEEAAQLKQLYNRYTTVLRAIRHHLSETYKAALLQSADKSHHEEEMRVFEILMAENEQWNEQSANLRKARTLVEERKTEEERLQLLIEMEREEVLRKETAAQVIGKEQEEVKHFISEETLDAEIEKALDARVNYSFALDLEGNRYLELADGTASLELGSGPDGVGAGDSTTPEDQQASGAV